MSNNKDEISKMYYSQLVIVFALLTVFIALFGISVVSLFQTEQAFQPLNDPSIIIFGFGIGNYISILFALVAQYTQNAALYIGQHFCKGNIVFKGELPFFGEIEIEDKKIADTAFWVSAFIDALTNVVWFYRSVQMPNDIVLGIMLRVIGYFAMIFSVFAEETMGVILDALKKARKQLSEIKNQEKRMKNRDDNSSGSVSRNENKSSKSFSSNNFPIRTQSNLNYEQSIKKYEENPNTKRIDYGN